MKVLVVGATGTLGREVVAQLVKAGHEVRAFTRRPSATDIPGPPNIKLVRGDLVDRGSIVRACQGTDAVLATAHSLLGTGEHNSRAVDDLGHRALIDAAKDSGVKRFVYLSARGATPEHPVDFFRTKARIESYLKASGLSFSILRPSPFMETHIHGMLGKGLLERGSATIYGAGRNAINFVSARDVATIALMSLNNLTANEESTEIGGPCNLSKCEVAETYLRLSGRPGKVQCVPIALMRLMRPIVRPFNPVRSRLLAMSIWLETTDQTFDASALTRTYPITLRRIEDFVREAIHKMSSDSLYSR